MEIQIFNRIWIKFVRSSINSDFNLNVEWGKLTKIPLKRRREIGIWKLNFTLLPSNCPPFGWKLWLGEIIEDGWWWGKEHDKKLNSRTDISQILARHHLDSKINKIKNKIKINKIKKSPWQDPGLPSPLLLLHCSSGTESRGHRRSRGRAGLKSFSDGEDRWLNWPKVFLTYPYRISNIRREMTDWR